MAKTYHAIGLMSGSSLDGLDIAYCRFTVDGAKIDWEILEAECVDYDEKWSTRLKKLYSQDGLTFAKTNTYYGHYMAQQVMRFIQKHEIEPDFIAAHGHTVFHEPEVRFTAQIGDGGAMAALTGYPVITGFRLHDVAIDGEGAPLAPIADKYLFNAYDFCLNLGGIANISSLSTDKLIAFDICATNLMLNFVARQLGFDYDQDGMGARVGTLNHYLLDELNNQDFFTHPYPKSMSNKWVQSRMIPILIRNRMAPEDKLATVTEHIATQITNSIKLIVQREGLSKPSYQMMVSGGGAFNKFLIERITARCAQEGLQVEIVVPEARVVEFKESLLMALMGVLRVENRPNVLASATGAKHDSISGAIYQGHLKTI
jgi:anhydro-N-acetylmuramic acid kinase